MASICYNGVVLRQYLFPSYGGCTFFVLGNNASFHGRFHGKEDMAPEPKRLGADVWKIVTLLLPGQRIFHCKTPMNLVVK